MPINQRNHAIYLLPNQWNQQWYNTFDRYYDGYIYN